MVFDSSTVMTPSLPTFSIAWAMIWTDFVIAIGGDGAHLGNHFAGDGLGEFAERAGVLKSAVFVALADNLLDSLVDAALQGHRVGSCSNCLDTFAIDGLGQNGRGGGAVAGNVGGLGGNFAHHLRAHVFQRIAKFNFLGYGYAVLGDGRGAEFLFNHDVAALGAERHLDSICQRIDAAQNCLPRIFSVQNLLCHNPDSPDVLFNAPARSG